MTGTSAHLLAAVCQFNVWPINLNSELNFRHHALPSE